MRSFKEDSKDHGHLHAGNSGNRPGKAVEGGIHWSVECSYQASPNVHAKYVLLSELSWGSHVAI